MAYVGNSPAAGIIDGGNVKDGSITNADLAAGVAVANLGYTPLNQAGDVSSGDQRLGAQRRLMPRYDASDSYSGAYAWNAIQLGNNGTNFIVAGKTAVGGGLEIWTNNTNEVSGGSAYIPNGNKAMAFDSFGRHTTPQQPAWQGYWNDASSAINRTKQALTETRSRGGITMSSNRITVPVTGWYRLHANGCFLQSYTATENDLYFYVNGTQIMPSAFLSQGVPSGGWVHNIINVLYPLAASDYIEVWFNGQVYSGGAMWNSINVELIG